MTPVMVSSSSRSSPERPERSRNAKAQARHRAKRKAYINHLEATVARLQALVGLPSADSSTTPSAALVKVRELEDENARLRSENDALRNQVADENEDDMSGSPTRDTFSTSRWSDKPYLPGNSAPRGLGSLLADPTPAGSRTSSHSSLASLGAASSPGGAPPSLVHSSSSIVDSPATSAGSPFSAAASPLVLPGLRLPPADVPSPGRALPSPTQYAQYGQQQQQQQQQASAAEPRAAYARTSYSALPPLSTQTQVLPAFTDYFPQAGQYVKAEDEHAYSHQNAYQHAYQHQYPTSYGTAVSYGLVSSDVGGWAQPAQRLNVHGGRS